MPLYLCCLCLFNTINTVPNVSNFIVGVADKNGNFITTDQNRESSSHLPLQHPQEWHLQPTMKHTGTPLTTPPNFPREILIISGSVIAFACFLALIVCICVCRRRKYKQYRDSGGAIEESPREGVILGYYVHDTLIEPPPRLKEPGRESWNSHLTLLNERGGGEEDHLDAHNRMFAGGKRNSHLV